ncbi:hypothetical protein [Moorena sp. SIO3A2]|uniref:hypothetical protein n=1 Tax=Moorena sp. SIO3A2 TaxID=2607841 RepID=UPI0013BC70C8|nr:hypothetical protein [Moorena sp. SIO3A2]NER90832.1 hypothetical protein [Moorena sp. SIO3A2]
MENNNSLVAEVKEKANLTNSEELSLEESQKILNLIEEGEIEEKHIKALAKDSPKFSTKFIESMTELVHTFPSLVEKVGDVNQEALDKIDHINHTVKTLKDLASNIQSDEGRIKIAELIFQISKDYNETLKEINANTNNTWSKIGGTIASAFVIGLAIIFQGFGGDST